MKHKSAILVATMIGSLLSGCFGDRFNEDTSGDDYNDDYFDDLFPDDTDPDDTDTGTDTGGGPSEPSGTLSAQAIAVTEDDAVGIQLVDDTLVIPSSNALASQIGVGSVLVGGSVEVPLLYRVLAIEHGLSDVTATVEPANLTDAFTDLYVEFSTIPTPYSAKRGMIEGITIYAHEKKSFTWEGSLNTSFDVADGITAGLEGTFKFAPGAEVKIDIADSSLREARFILSGQYDTTLKEYVQVSDSVSTTYTASIMPMTGLATFVVIIPVGFIPVPIYIRVRGGIEGGLELALEGGFNTSFGQRTSGNLTMGFEYGYSGWRAVTSESPLAFTAIPPSLEIYANASIKPYIKPKLDILFFVAGPFMALEGYGKLNIKSAVTVDSTDPLGVCDSASIAAGFSGMAGGTVSVLGYSGNIEATLLDLSKDIWSDKSEECDTDTDTDTDYQDYYYLDAPILLGRYEVVARGADLAGASHAALSVTIGGITFVTDEASGAPSVVWDEPLAQGSIETIASDWVIETDEGAECSVQVTREMVEEWGGFSIDICGELRNLAFHFNPVY